MIAPPHLLRFALCCVLAAAVDSSVQAAEQIRIVKDLPYKSSADDEYEQERCKLDLYLPAGGTGFATIVWFHGGSLQSGDKAGDIARTAGLRFAADGIAVAAVNYRLHPRVEFPAYIEDAAAACRFVRDEIVKHGGSPERIFISGHSAGGYLTAMVGADPQYLARHGLKPGDIAGLIPISGQMITHSTVRKERGIPATRPLIDSAAPAFHAGPDTAPWLIVAGDQDLPARAEESRYFAAALKAAGHKAVAHLEVEGRNHGTVASKLGEPEDAVAKAMIAFIQRSANKEK